MKILGIETSCDETSVAALEAGGGREAPRFRVLAATTHSQIDAHRAYGGVYPTLAKREHGKNLVPVLLETLTNAGLMGSPTSKIPEVGLPKMYRLPTKELQNIFEREPELLAQFTEIIPSIEKPALDAIAVTVGPGLQPALWVGVNFARALPHCLRRRRGKHKTARRALYARRGVRHPPPPASVRVHGR